MIELPDDRSQWQPHGLYIQRGDADGLCTLWRTGKAWEGYPTDPICAWPVFRGTERGCQQWAAKDERVTA